MNIAINGKDARKTWGIVFDSSAISALMTPAAMKAYIENSSRTEHGKRVVTNASIAKLDSRQVNLTFALYQSSEDDFFENMLPFVTKYKKQEK